VADLGDQRRVVPRVPGHQLPVPRAGRPLQDPTATMLGPGGARRRRRLHLLVLSVSRPRRSSTSPWASGWRHAGARVVQGAAEARHAPADAAPDRSVLHGRRGLPLRHREGGGLLYTAVANSRLLFAAAVSQVLLGRRQTPWQWTVLSGICLATVAYASLGASGRSGAADGPGGLGQAAAGTLLALWKALASGLAAVLTESRYKHLDLWQANTLLKAQSLAVALAAGALRAAAVEDTDTPLCPSEPWCVDRRGWDCWTWGVLTTEIGAGWLSVAVLTRMSAVAKFICKTATAPSIYLFYIATGFRDVRFELRSFLAVLAIAAGILAYTRLEALRRATEAKWVDEYTPGPSRPAPAALPRRK
ncbi:unnamed protein product, partial [Prorocentrum cordatum]